MSTSPSPVMDQIAALSAKLSAVPGRLLELPVTEIDPDPGQARSSLHDGGDGATELAELATSIREHGVLNPVLVVRDDISGRYTLVAGERRWRAAQLAGLERIPAIPLPPAQSEPDRREVIALTENLQRQDLKPLEIAKALGAYLDRTAIDKGALANLLGKSPTWISRHLALLRAAGPGLEALEEGRILDTDTFRLFAKLPLARQERLLKQARTSGLVISRREASQALNRREPQRPKPASNPPTDKPETTQEDPLITLTLSTDKVRALFQVLDLPLPDDLHDASRALAEWLDSRPTSS